MTTWLPQVWCSSFVLTLGHFLWQGTLIAVLLAMASRAVKSVAARYWLSLAALLVMAVCPMATLGWLLRPVTRVAMFDNSPIVHEELAATSGVGQASNLPVSPSIASLEFNATETIPRVPADQRSWWQRFAPHLTTAYLSGVALMLLRLVAGLWGGRRLRRRVHLIDDETLLSAMRRQAAALGLKVLPVLAYCERVTVPTVVGVLKPMILLPLTLTSGLSLEQIESVLAHELAHLRRCDHLVNLLQRVIESLLFFHPAMWWVSHRIREEREHCCDDLVVDCGAMPLDYAKSLLVVAELSHTSKLRRSVAAVSLLATDGNPSSLRQRIARLLGESATPSLRVSPRVLLLSIGIPLIAFIVAIRSGASNPESSADKGEQPPVANSSATLPNGVTVQLIGVGFHPSEKREWWRANGSPLGERPYEKLEAWVLKGDPRQADCREFVVQVRGLPKDHALTSRFSRPAATAFLGRSRDGAYSTEMAAGPFPGDKTTSVGIGLSLEPLGPAQWIDADGSKFAAVDVPADVKLLYDVIQPMRVESFGAETELVLKPIDELHQKVDWQMVAIDNEGQAIRSSSSSNNGQDVTLGFKLPRERITRFEYRLRPYRHWVTFENVSLQPGQQTDVKVSQNNYSIDGLLHRFDVPAGQTARSEASPPLGFSERREIVLSMDNLKYMLDLDGGQTMDPSQKGRPEQKKMDVCPLDARPNEAPAGLQGLSLRGVRMNPDGWYVSVAELQQELASDRVGALTKLPYDPDEKATYFVRTADGTDGILQLLAQTDEPKGIRLCYKTFKASKVNAEIKVGMTFDELIALKGRHYRLSHGMRVGNLILVYDDIAISVDAPPNAKGGGKVTGFEPGIPKEVVQNVPYADEDASPPKGLEFLKPYSKLHGLSLDMTEPHFLEIVKQQELKTRKTVDGEKVTHHIALGDGHALIVMFDRDAKCSGIQRVRAEVEDRLKTIDSGPVAECRAIIKRLDEAGDVKLASEARERLAKRWKWITEQPVASFLRELPKPDPNAAAEDRGPLVGVQTELDGVWSNGKGTADDWKDWIVRKQNGYRVGRLQLLFEAAHGYRKIEDATSAKRVLQAGLSGHEIYDADLKTLIGKYWPVTNDEPAKSLGPGPEAWTLANYLGELSSAQQVLGEIDPEIITHSRLTLAHFMLSWNQPSAGPTKHARELWALIRQRTEPLPPLFWFNVVDEKKTQHKFDLSGAGQKGKPLTYHHYNLTAAPSLDFAELTITARTRGRKGILDCYRINAAGKHETIILLQPSADGEPDQTLTKTLKVPAGTGLVQFMVAGEDFEVGEVTVEAKFVIRAVAAKVLPPVGLEFLKPYPKLHGLSLDMTEPRFLEIVKQQEGQFAQRRQLRAARPASQPVRALPVGPNSSGIGRNAQFVPAKC